MTTAAEPRDAEGLRSLVERTVFTPLRHGSAVADTVARLGQAIGMGLLQPGDRLPPEERLADELGISPVTLRSALGILRSAGLIETRRGRAGGTFVRRAASTAGLPVESGVPGERELRELADERRVVEGGVAELAAARASAEQLAELLRLLDEMEQTESFEDWGARDTLFHLVLADATGSERLVTRVAALRAEVFQISRHFPTPRPVLELAEVEHRQILRAVRSGRGTRARETMARHAESTLALWLGLLPAA
jgi:DNA-binding FadR family transcriptional regulator